MRKTEHIFLQGKSKWTRVDHPDQYGAYSTVLYPNAASMKKIYELKERGLLNVIKKDEDGEYITFKRPTQKTINGKVRGFTPPECLDAQGNKLKAFIGNGSDVTVKLEVYGYKSPLGGKEGVAARLDSIRVDNLVPYERESFPEDEKKQVEGLDEQPQQLF